MIALKKSPESCAARSRRPVAGSGAALASARSPPAFSLWLRASWALIALKRPLFCWRASAASRATAACAAATATGSTAGAAAGSGGRHRRGRGRAGVVEAPPARELLRL